MHTTVVISAGDAPEWISVLHADGSLSEVKVAVENDTMHIFVEPAQGKRYTLKLNDPDRSAGAVVDPGRWFSASDIRQRYEGD
jgi:hypothetical protein